jgi:hypothetical protein
MKVYIGPYKDFIGPCQIADMIFFWCEKYPSDELDQRWDYQLRDKVSNWLYDSWVNNFCNWIYEKNERKVKVRIDKYDTWSVDNTLALIILPLLKQFKEIHHGSPLVDDEDVPDELKSTSAPPKENEWDTDANHHKRWEWVIDEMIWAFECKVDNSWEDQFWNNTNDKLELDREGYNKYRSRIINGLKLFGKYYENLWD